MPVMLGTVLALVALLLASTVEAQSLRERMLAAEDARPQAAEELAPLIEGVKSPDASLRRQAVRALGRLERPDLMPIVATALADADVVVRSEGYNALGQLARGAAAAADVHDRIVARMESERDAAAWGVAAATLGRLPYSDAAQVTRAEQALAPVIPAPPEQSRRSVFYGHPDAMLGATRGLEALVRLSRKIAVPSAPTLESLRAASVLRGGVGDDRFPRIRRLAWLALTVVGQIDAPRVESGLADPDEEVRRLAVAAAGADILIDRIDRRAMLLGRGLVDVSSRVRYEALRSWGRHFQKTSCVPMLTGIRDESPHVKLQAIDLLGAGCNDRSAIDTLQALAEVLRPGPSDWHAPAHALVALARVAPAEARTLMPRYVKHGTWQVRMYAARAAGALGALDELETLAGDPHDNVREAALTAMIELRRSEVIPLAIDALASRNDYQLLLTAARGLEAMPAEARTRARPALIQAMTRVTAEQHETSRDPRMAILDRMNDIGTAEGAESSTELRDAVRARLRDFDPAVARKAAEILEAWTGASQHASPQSLPKPRVDLSRLGRNSHGGGRDTRLRFTMAGKGTFTLRLLGDEAPLSALRVLTRAQEGYYNGLTFHRVAPNFVIQGGSPGANEYMGDGPFMRDEVGLVSHTRGTVGISTRGRDTGDAQIFVNLVDSPRLDHTYTVFAEVVDGMDVVDAILEGDVIERVEVL
jgi:cyclophilin family peptidyl-prolyl cis-trans isomerase/HEAT repeat protein